MSGISHNQRNNFLERKWQKFDIEDKTVDTLIDELAADGRKTNVF